PQRFAYELDGLLVVSGSTDLEWFGRNAHVDLDHPIHDTHGVRVHREHGRQGAYFASQEIESRPVARALDQALVELALSEDAAVVRAHVVDRAPRVVVTVAEGQTLVARVHDLHLADRHLVGARDRHELAQIRTPISAMLPMR